MCLKATGVFDLRYLMSDPDRARRSAEMPRTCGSGRSPPQRPPRRPTEAGATTWTANQAGSCSCSSAPNLWPGPTKLNRYTRHPSVRPTGFAHCCRNAIERHERHSSVASDSNVVPALARHVRQHGHAGLTGRNEEAPLCAPALRERDASPVWRCVAAEAAVLPARGQPMWTGEVSVAWCCFAALMASAVTARPARKMTAAAMNAAV